ncbi:RNA polymerase-binding transcription factor DksA [Gammaproteobacteria bacterium]
MTVVLPPGYRPSPEEPYMNPRQLAYFQEKLLKWKEELLTESRDTLEYLRQENWHESDMVDRASVEADANLELRTRNRYRKLLPKIDAALKRIEEGKYGYCEETGEAIGLRRLEVRPIATLGIEAQERHEKLERRQGDPDY